VPDSSPSSGQLFQLLTLIISPACQPRVVRFVDTFEESPLSTILIMEYCGAYTLWHQYRERELRRDEMLIVLQQSLEGFVYLHKAEVTYRDLKVSRMIILAKTRQTSLYLRRPC